MSFTPGPGTTYLLTSTQPIPSGTANGVLFLNASKVVTSGSALTFDGNRIAIASNLGTPSTGGFSLVLRNVGGDANDIGFGVDSSFNLWANVAASGPGFISYIGGIEQMRLTSTGLGIGTSSPGAKLDVAGGTFNGTVLNISQTWSGTGTYTGIKYNVTDSGPANVASLLMDLQEGGSSRFRVNKAGSVVSRGSLNITDGIYTSSFSLSPINGYTGLFTIGLEGELRWGVGAKLIFASTGNTAQWLFNTGGIEPGTSGLAIRTSHNGFFGFNTVGNTVAYDAIGHDRTDNSNSGLIFRAKSGGTTSEAARITSVGNVKIGGTANRATTVGTRSLDIFNGTAPAGTLTNGISIYSDAGEAYVMDAAGNATLFSPHDSETNEWIFRSKHTPTGKVLKIDVERLLRFVNDHFGLDAVREFVEA